MQRKKLFKEKMCLYIQQLYWQIVVMCMQLMNLKIVEFENYEKYNIVIMKVYVKMRIRIAVVAENFINFIVIHRSSIDAIYTHVFVCVFMYIYAKQMQFFFYICAYNNPAVKINKTDRHQVDASGA